MMALACAGLSADCVLPFAVGSMVYAEEFEVVPDEGSTEDPGISVVADSGDTAAVSEDVFAIDGLIEVVEEHSDSSGFILRWDRSRRWNSLWLSFRRS